MLTALFFEYIHRILILTNPTNAWSTYRRRLASCKDISGSEFEAAKKQLGSAVKGGKKKKEAR